MKAILNKETEKAVNITFQVELYGENFTIKNQWIPKSQIEIISTENGILEFNTKNDWILNAKVKEYCKYINDIFDGNVKIEIKTYLSNINNVVVDYCWA